jgi:Lrp/AsnC family leucine-responsive transcriptional regulator
MNSKRYAMDKLDKAILEQMQENSRVTAEQLSERVGLSPSACQRRLSVLRKSGVIEKEVAVLSPDAIANRITVIVEVTFEHDRPDVLNTFKAAMRKRSEVMQCYYVAGNTDFILIITVQNMDQYEVFSRRYFQDNTSIKRYQTNVVTERVKVSLSVPVSEVTRIDD